MSFGTDAEQSEGFSGFVDLGPMEDVKEPEIVPAGDYTVEIVKAEHQDSKKGDPMTHLTFKVLDSNMPNPNLIHTYLMHPQPDDEEEMLNNKKLSFKRLIECFGIELVDGKLDIALLTGQTGQVTLGVQPAKGEYGPSNRITRWHPKY